MSEGLEQYLAEHGVELGVWRMEILDVGAVYAGSQRVAERREDGCECVECNGLFDTEREARAHYALAHACEEEREDSDSRGEQTKLTQFTDIGKSLITEQGGGQAKLVV